MLEGTFVKLGVFGPDLDNPTSNPVRSRISEDRLEFADISKADIVGDAWQVVAASFDISGSRLDYRIIDTRFSGFGDVDDDTGFNGYVLRFDGLRDNPNLRLRHVDLKEHASTLAMTDALLSHSDAALRINVDALRFRSGDSFALELGFEIRGSHTVDFLTGGNGRDELVGLRGDDILSGSGGRDRLIGGKGADALTGGAGADLFIFERASDSKAKASARDTIFDFQHDRDRIDLSGIDDGLVFVGRRRFDEEPGQVRYKRQGDDSLVQADIDGDGRADLAILLRGASQLGEGDFVL